MRIAFFTDSFYPAINGIVSGLCSYANGLVEAGHSVMIFAPDHPMLNSVPWILDKRIKVRVFPSLKGNIVPDFRFMVPNWSVYRELKKFKPDIIHTHTPMMLGFSGLVLGKFMQIPVVTTCHGNFTVAESLKLIDMYESRIARQIQRRAGFMLKNYLEAHDAIFFPTLRTKENLKELQLGQHQYVVHVPIPFKQLKEGRKYKNALRVKFGIKQSLIFAGRLSKEKNVDKLIRVFARCKKKLPKLQLVLIGDGPARESLTELVENLGVASSAIFIGAVPYQELIEKGYFYLGDVFVTLSEFETQGMSTVEAMACGLPVVGAKAQATTEVIGGVGVLVHNRRPAESAQQICALFKDEASFLACQKKGVERAREYTIEQSTTGLLTAYEEILRKHMSAQENDRMRQALLVITKKARKYPKQLRIWVTSLSKQ